MVHIPRSFKGAAPYAAKGATVYAGKKGGPAAKAKFLKVCMKAGKSMKQCLELFKKQPKKGRRQAAQALRGRRSGVKPHLPTGYSPEGSGPHPQI